MADLELTNKETVVIDGYIVDAESGEVLGLAQKEEFHITDEESFNWVMKKFLDTESKLESIEHSPEVAQAKAILANAESMTKDAQRRLDWLTARFSQELAEYARPQLPKGSKSFKTIYGTVSFRSVPAKLVVYDLPSALEWAKKHCPEAIKVTEDFQFSKVNKALIEDLKRQKGFAVIDGSEKVTIKTGVE